MRKLPCRSCHLKCGDNSVDPATLALLEEGFQLLCNSDSKSLLKKHLTREIFDNLKTRKTSYGSTLLDCIQSGIANLDSEVGIYAPDAEAYEVFAELFDEIIEDYHLGFEKGDCHPPQDWCELEAFGIIEPIKKYVLSTRICCGRSIEGYPFNPRLTEQLYKKLEKKISSAVCDLTEKLEGTVYPLTEISEEFQQQLINNHFLFKEDDRFLQAANASRFWPTGRSIFYNNKMTFLVCINEKDHLKIISMQNGSNLGAVYRRFVLAVTELEMRLEFSKDARLGNLTFSPTNLGTSLKASVLIKIPKLAKDKAELEAIAEKYCLKFRCTHIEDSKAKKCVYEISNKRRIGLVEFEIIRQLFFGVREIIKTESSM